MDLIVSTVQKFVDEDSPGVLCHVKPEFGANDAEVFVHPVQAHCPCPITALFTEVGDGDLHIRSAFGIDEGLGLGNQIGIEAAAKPTVGGTQNQVDFFNLLPCRQKRIAFPRRIFPPDSPRLRRTLGRKGWKFSIAVWAPRNREAATMFMALVICRVFLTAPIFNLTSFSCAIQLSLYIVSRFRLSFRLPPRGNGLFTAYLMVSFEFFVVRGQSLVHHLFDLFGECLLFFQAGQNLRVPVFEELIQAGLVFGQHVYRVFVRGIHGCPQKGY